MFQSSIVHSKDGRVNHGSSMRGVIDHVVQGVIGVSGHDYPRSSDAMRAGGDGSRIDRPSGPACSLIVQSVRRPSEPRGPRSSGVRLSRDPDPPASCRVIRTACNMPSDESNHRPDDRQRRGGIQPGIHAVADHGRQRNSMPIVVTREAHSNPRATADRDSGCLTTHDSRFQTARQNGARPEACSHRPGSSIDRTQSSRLATSRQGTILSDQSTGQFLRVNSSAPVREIFHKVRPKD